MIVADSNLIAYLLISGEKTPLAEQVLLKDRAWAAPLLCRSEIRSILTQYMRHENMSLVQSNITMDMAERILGGREYAVPSHEVLQVTFHENISAYDAEFVVLAKQLEVPLVTFDQKVLKTFPRIAVSAVDFLQA